MADHDFDYHRVYIPDGSGYNLERLVLMTYRDSRYVWYGWGPWFLHFMDWRGANIWHGRIPGSPTFKDGEEALDWALEELNRPGGLHRGMHLPGHHAGEQSCSKGCDEREVKVAQPAMMSRSIVSQVAELYLPQDPKRWMPGVLARQRRNVRLVKPLTEAK